MLEGTYRPDRAPANEPTPLGKPSCPRTLTKDAAKQYRSLVKQLSEMGLIGRIDAFAIERYTRTWLRWRKVVAVLEQAGEVQVFRKKEKDAEGKEVEKVVAVQPNALVSVERGLSERLDRLEASFGMNPSSRSRISVEPTPAQDELSEFLGGQK